MINLMHAWDGKTRNVYKVVMQEQHLDKWTLCLAEEVDQVDWIPCCGISGTER